MYHLNKFASIIFVGVPIKLLILYTIDNNKGIAKLYFLLLAAKML